MKIKLFVFALTLIAIMMFGSCGGQITDIPNSESINSESFSETIPKGTVEDTEETEEKTSNYLEVPYVVEDEIENDEQAKLFDWESVLETIPSDRYEQYGKFNSAPLTATLYKNGESIELDIYDPRLVRLLNFYYNETYHKEYGYSQGMVNEVYEEYKNFDFRLELTYAPQEEKFTEINGSTEFWFDEMMICMYSFIIVDHNTIGPEGELYISFSRHPLCKFYFNWLDIFGF